MSKVKVGFIMVDDNPKLDLVDLNPPVSMSFAGDDPILLGRDIDNIFDALEKYLECVKAGDNVVLRIQIGEPLLKGINGTIVQKNIEFFILPDGRVGVKGGFDENTEGVKIKIENNEVGDDINETQEVC